MNRQRGFTLIEVLVTMVVATLLLGVGVPQMRSLMADHQMTAQANRLVADLKYARTEAIRQGVPVTQ